MSSVCLLGKLASSTDFYRLSENTAAENLLNLVTSQIGSFHRLPQASQRGCCCSQAPICLLGRLVTPTDFLSIAPPHRFISLPNFHGPGLFHAVVDQTMMFCLGSSSGYHLALGSTDDIIVDVTQYSSHRCGTATCSHWTLVGITPLSAYPLRCSWIAGPGDLWIWILEHLTLLLPIHAKHVLWCSYFGISIFTTSSIGFILCGFRILF